MASLYELTGQYLEIYNMELDEETKLDTLDSIDWEIEYETKVENYIKVMKNIDADVEARKAEIKRLTELNKADEKKKEHLKEDLKNGLEIIGASLVERKKLSIR
jgi:hypothetical protein